MAPRGTWGAAGEEQAWAQWGKSGCSCTGSGAARLAPRQSCRPAPDCGAPRRGGGRLNISCGEIIGCQCAEGRFGVVAAAALLYGGRRVTPPPHSMLTWTGREGPLRLLGGRRERRAFLWAPSAPRDGCCQASALAAAGAGPRGGGSCAVLLNRGRTTNPVCPVERRSGAFPHCGIVVHIVGLDHKSLLHCLWAEPRHISERYLRNGSPLTAVNRPMEEQMSVTSRPMKALLKVESYNPPC